jgi:predicted metallopeptidase
MLRVCQRIHELVDDIASTCSEFSHIDSSRIAIRCRRVRSAKAYGVWASCTALGPRKSGPLYRILFTVPRFFDRSFEDKLMTVVHEMYHISPNFDGRLRRFKARGRWHGPCEKLYDQKMHGIANNWLERTQHPEKADFLRFSIRSAEAVFGHLDYRQFSAPKPFPKNVPNPGFQNTPNMSEI